MRGLAPVGALIAAALVTIAACNATRADEPPVPKAKKSKKVSDEERRDALSRATVWQQPAVPISRAHLGADPAQSVPVSCRFATTELSGTAPKFDCTLENGERLRVKYGRSPEIPSEVAAARLLHALGFAADDMMLVEHLRCHGCPAEPFITMRGLGLVGAEELYGKVANQSGYKDFEWVAVERKHRGRPIETESVEGWAFFELDQIDPRKGGAPRAHVDSLRLLSVLIAHWDNKSENQRLVCLSQADWPDGGRCARPLAMLQDVGGAFGPRKVDLSQWEKAPIWADRAGCVATMEHLPYQGATFKPVRISEDGRRHLATLLEQLSDAQIGALFSGARFDQSKGMMGFTASPVPEWVRAFKQKVREISDGPACPQ